MKNRLFNAFLLLALVGTMFASCKKEYPQPPIQNLPIGTVYTIQDILNMSTGTVFDTASVYGIVTADEVSGNLYKMCFIQDRATGAAIELKLSSTSGVRIGDSIRVYLKDVLFEKYHNLPQLSGFGPDGHIIILANNKQIEPKTVTISDIRSGSYVGALVKIENAEFRLKNVPFCETGEATNRIMDDSTFTNTTDDPNYAEFVVRTSNYANFAFDYMPISKGSIVGIASVYNSTYQLIIRSKSELDFAEWGHPTPVTPVVPGEVQSLPYTQSFDTEFGTYMSYSVLNDDYFWKIDYHTAKMTGFVSQTESHANEDWLISSPVAITGVNDAKMKMIYVGRYFNNINEDVTIWASSNYTWGSDPTTASWTQVPAVLSEASSWSDFLTTEIALTDYVGQTITIAVKYLSTDTKAGTMEVQSITVEEGTAGGDTPPGPGPGTVEGDGSRENPYTANDIIVLGIENSDGQKYWVKDYIVGVVNGSYEYEFTSATDVNTNITLSSNVNASNESECIPVQLPYGDVRAGLNLADNPGNLGQEVLLYGTLEVYFRKAGVKNVTYAEINGNSYGTDPTDTPTPPDPGTTEYFNQTLTTQDSYNTFTAYSVTGDQEWYQNSSHLEYGAVMSGYANNTSYANEDWFISPTIDLSASTNPVLNFDHARGPANSINVGVAEGYYTVWVTNDYTTGEDPTQERWVEITGINHGTSAWGFVNSGNLVIPAEFKTATCRIAFRYLSVDGASATWEIKNVVVREQ